MRKAVFLDRDGVINRKAPEGQYIVHWEDVQFISGVPEAMVLLHRAGFFAIVVSNQRCVSKGLVSIGKLQQLHRRMLDHLAADGPPSMLSTIVPMTYSLPALAANSPLACF